MSSIITVIIGVVVSMYGVLITLGIIKTNISKDPEVDKRLLSKKSRYFLSRYNSGIQFIVGGLVLIFLGFLLL